MTELEQLKQTAVERIYLVPSDCDGQLVYAWCDDPAPSPGMNPEEAVEYVRRDVFDAVEVERDALAVHVARIGAALTGPGDYEQRYMRAYALASDRLTASVAAHDAALLRSVSESITAQYNSDHVISAEVVHGLFCEQADKIERGEGV